ncbi:MAG: YbhB/YbcL family Raf kinase inhibitor-like protein [Candidatus Zixiibacteriota bacterium]|nr:MAG: YbhB/YbcL family Raf kinase inhibitor-like protein [candidate division Zixibacteria bacterium]
MAMTITSPAFSEGETIPVKHTCDSSDVSPALAISGVPTGARSLAIICDDPDAPMGTWVHWVVFDIPPDISELPEGFGNGGWAARQLDSTGGPTVHGKTDFGGYGYGGPCPPPGKAHRYYFKLYALDTVLAAGEEEIEAGIFKVDLLKKMEGHILAEASLMGKYKR